MFSRENKIIISDLKEQIEAFTHPVLNKSLLTKWNYFSTLKQINLEKRHTNPMTFTAK